MDSFPTLAEVPLALLAGGRGTRLRGVADGVPKALIEVAGEPFIAHQLALLRRGGIMRVVLCIGHLGDQVEACVGDGARFSLSVEYCREGERLLGTAGALKQAASTLGRLFWVMYGDTYLDVDFGEILEAFRGSTALGLMTVFRNENRFDRSNVLFRDGRLLAYDKESPRPEMAHIDYGLALLREEALGPVPPGEPYDLGDLYRAMAGRGLLQGFEIRRRFYEIGSPEGLAETRRFFEPRRAQPA